MLILCGKESSNLSIIFKRAVFPKRNISISNPTCMFVYTKVLKFLDIIDMQNKQKCFKAKINNIFHKAFVPPKSQCVSTQISSITEERLCQTGVLIAMEKFTIGMCCVIYSMNTNMQVVCRVRIFWMR